MIVSAVREASATLHALSDGAAGIAETLERMVLLVRQYKTSPVIRRTAENILSAVPEKSAYSEVRAIRQFTRRSIRYTMDVRDVETLKTPILTLESMHGDCDDQATLAATLLESVGYACRFVAIGFTGAFDFSHVYTEVKLGKSWLSVETTEDVDIGWQPPQVQARMVRHI